MNTIFDKGQIGLKQSAVLKKDGVTVTGLVKWAQAIVGNVVSYRDANGNVTGGWKIDSINTPTEPNAIQRGNGNLRKRQLRHRPGKVTQVPR